MSDSPARSSIKKAVEDVATCYEFFDVDALPVHLRAREREDDRAEARGRERESEKARERESERARERERMGVGVCEP